MKVLIAIDSLKGSLTSNEAGAAISDGIKKAMPDAEVVIRPLADGGEGTVSVLTPGLNGHLEKVTVTGPLCRQVQCEYGIIENNSFINRADLNADYNRPFTTKTAIIEMAGAAGITLIDESERNPLHTTTFGVGEVIKDAIKKGCRNFIVGIGGSATNDCGIGMLQALGYEFKNSDGNEAPKGALGLKDIKSIKTEHVLPELKECTFNIACDVTNPLCGKNGCSAVFGPQKGATPDMIAQMDEWIRNFAELVRVSFSDSENNAPNNYDNPVARNADSDYPVACNADPDSDYPVACNADPEYPGSGAAGGMGFAFLAFTNAVLKSGVQLILEETHLEDYIQDADIVITGEGRLDSQTVMGKAPIGVAKLAKKYNKTVIAFSGCVTPDAGICNEYGIDAFFPILRSVSTLEEACNPENAYKNMSDTAEQVFRLIKLIYTL